MPSDEDIALSEKRMYGDRREETRVYVAGSMGVAYVAASDDQIGRFGLETQCSARDVAGGGGRLIVATDEGVLVGGEDGLESAGFGPAVAVGADPLLAAGEDGRVARRVDGGWETVGTVEDVRAIDGDLVAAGGGVYRAGDDLTELASVAASDVAAAGPYAATADGVRALGDGRIQVAGEATVVAAAATRAHAVVDGDLLARSGEDWIDVDPPRDGVVDVAYGEATFAVTGDGTVLLDPVTAKDGEPGWRARSIGLADVVGVAVP